MFGQSPRFHRVLGCSLLGVWLLSAFSCESQLSQKIAARKRSYEGSAGTVLQHFLDDYDKEALKLFEQRDRLEGVDHPLWKWRRALAQSDFLATAESLAEQYKSTQQGPAFNEIVGFLRDARDFWVGDPEVLEKALKEGKTPPRNPKAHNEYMKFLNEYIARNEKGGPALAQVRIERELIHAIYFFNREKYDADTQATSMARFWKFAFDLPMEDGEAFMTFADRLCKERIDEFCRKVMHEHRPYALNIPYLERLTKNLEAYLHDYPATPYKELLQDLMQKYRQAAAAIGPFEEYPVFPDGWAVKDAVGQSWLEMGPRGVFWNGQKIVEFPKGSFELDRPGQEKVLQKVVEELQKLLKEQEEGGNLEPEIDLVRFDLAKGVPMANIEPIITAGLQKNFVFSTAFVTRERADGSNRKGATYMVVFYEPAPFAEDIVKRLSKADLQKRIDERKQHDPRLKIPERIAGMACVGVARTGKPLSDMEQPRGYVALSANGLQIGPIDETKRAGAAQFAFKKGEPLDWARIQDWVAKLGKQPLILAVQTALPIEAFTPVLEHLHLGCRDAACTKAAERDDPIIALALCH